MKRSIKSYSSINNSLTNLKGETIMKNLTSQISTENTSSSNAILYGDQLNNMDFSHLKVGTEYSIYDSISDGYFTLDGKRISLKKEYETRVVIGCVECPEYMVMEDEQLENISCSELVDQFLLLVNSQLSQINRIAA